MLRAVIQSALTFGLSGKLLRRERFNCLYQQSSIRSICLCQNERSSPDRKNPNVRAIEGTFIINTQFFSSTADTC